MPDPSFLFRCHTPHCIGTHTYSQDWRDDLALRGQVWTCTECKEPQVALLRLPVSRFSQVLETA